MLKSLPKIIAIFFLVVFIFQLACLLFLTLAPNTSQAADPIKFTPQVQVSDYAFDASDKSTGNIARYVRAIYKYAIGIVGILAAVVLMIGGVMWIVAGGSSTMIGEAKSWIGASLTGLVIALCSYLILATINPALVDLKTSPVKNVENTNTNIGCCVITALPKDIYKDSVTEDQCIKENGRWNKGVACPTAAVGLRSGGCCSGYCTTKFTKETCDGTWFTEPSDCSADGFCKKINTSQGCCSYSMPGPPMQARIAGCASKSSQAECDNYKITTPSWTEINFDPNKNCLSNICVPK